MAAICHSLSLHSSIWQALLSKFNDTAPDHLSVCKAFVPVYHKINSSLKDKIITFFSRKFTQPYKVALFVKEGGTFALILNMSSIQTTKMHRCVRVPMATIHLPTHKNPNEKIKTVVNVCLLDCSIQP